MFKGNKKLVSAIVLLVVAVAGSLSGYVIYNETRENDNTETNTQETTTQYTATVKITNDKGETSFTQDFNEGATAFDVLQKLDANSEDFTFEYQEYEGMGAFLTSVNGIAPDDSHFWSTYINGTQMQVGVSGYSMQNGDELGLVYEEIM